MDPRRNRQRDGLDRRRRAGLRAALVGRRRAYLALAGRLGNGRLRRQDRRYRRRVLEKRARSSWAIACAGAGVFALLLAGRTLEIGNSAEPYGSYAVPVVTDAGFGEFSRHQTLQPLR